MVRVIVTCEGFDNIIYSGGVWLSTNGCYDWPSLIQKALVANGVTETKADCYLLGVPVNIKLTDLDILQNNDTLVLRPRASRSERRTKRVRERSGASDDPRRRVKRSKLVTTRTRAVGRSRQSKSPNSMAKSSPASPQFAASVSRKSDKKATPASVEMSGSGSGNSFTQSSPSRHSVSLKHSPPKSLDPNESRESETNRKHRKLTEIIERYQENADNLSTDRLYRAFIEEVGHGHKQHEETKHVSETVKSNNEYAKKRKTSPHHAIHDSMKGEPDQIESKFGVQNSEEVSLADGPNLLSSLNLPPEPSSSELLRLRLLYCVGPLAPRRAWFFDHIIEPYDNKVPLVVVAAHIQDSSKSQATAALVSNIIDDAIFIGSLRSDYYRVFSDQNNKRIFQILFLSPDEENRLARKRSLGLTTMDCNKHLVATVAGDKEEGGGIDDCPLCRVLEQFLLPHSDSIRPRHMVLSKSDSKSTLHDCPRDIDLIRADWNTQVSRDEGASAEDSSSYYSSSSSGQTSSVDELLCQDECGACSSENTNQLSMSDVPDSSISEVRSCLSAIPPGRVISVVEKLKSAAHHAGRSQEGLIRRHVGALIGTSCDTLVLKNRFTNAMHCVPMAAILNVKDAASSDPCVLYSSLSEEVYGCDVRASASSEVIPAEKCFNHNTNRYSVFPNTLSEHPILSDRKIPPMIKAKEDLNELNKWMDTEVSIVKQRIARQCTWYFSEKNLKNDKFLISRLQAHNGKLPLKLLMSFNKLAALTTDESLVIAVLKELPPEKSRITIIEEDGDRFLSPAYPLDMSSGLKDKATKEPQTSALIPSVLLRRTTGRKSDLPVLSLDSGDQSKTANHAAPILNPLLAATMPAPGCVPGENDISAASQVVGKATFAVNRLGENVEIDCQSSERESSLGTLGAQSGSTKVPSNLIGARPRNAPRSLNF